MWPLILKVLKRAIRKNKFHEVKNWLQKYILTLGLPALSNGPDITTPPVASLLFVYYKAKLLIINTTPSVANTRGATLALPSLSNEPYITTRPVASFIIDYYKA